MLFTELGTYKIFLLEDLMILYFSRIFKVDKVENIIEQPDFVEQTLLENQNSKTIKEIKEEEKINKEKEKFR